VLQRSDAKGGWVDVTLLDQIPEDPIFVIKVADCFAELSRVKLPSTLHRRRNKQGTCIAQMHTVLSVPVHVPSL
jgi:isopenicillin N synthase-like dioxygenase